MFVSSLLFFYKPNKLIKDNPLNNQLLINSLSHWSLISRISSLSFDDVFFKIEIQITFLDVPQAFPKAFFEGIKT